MKLSTFDAENMVSQRKGDAVIAISRKSANSISKAAAERMGYGWGFNSPSPRRRNTRGLVHQSFGGRVYPEG